MALVSGQKRNPAASLARVLRAGLARSPRSSRRAGARHAIRFPETADRKPQSFCRRLFAPGFAWSIQLISICRVDSLHSALPEEVEFQREEMRYSGRTNDKLKSILCTKCVLGEFCRCFLSLASLTTSPSTTVCPCLCYVFITDTFPKSLLSDAAPFKCKLCKREVGTPSDSLV